MEPFAMEKVKREKSKVEEQRISSRFGHLLFAFCLLPFALCLAGCVSTGSFMNLGVETPGSVPCQVVATWNPGVVSTTDPVHDGAQTPGLVGRIYLFGPEIGCPL